jgi:hypothetical protein
MNGLEDELSKRILKMIKIATTKKGKKIIASMLLEEENGHQ